MLHFSDTPYDFYPAKPNRLVIWAGQALNLRRNLPGSRHRIRGVEVRGRERLDVIRRDAGNRLLLLPNHSTHSDPQIMVEAHRQLGTASCFMAAYDVFLKNRLLAWFMQRGGCFSVDRDGSDSKSMKAAIQILTEGDYGLTIFPEGNVYLMNDRVTPFLEGAAFLAMKAQKELGEKKSIYAVPVSIKATHLTDQREVVRDRLDCLAKDMGTALDREVDFMTELKRIGLAALERNLRQRGLIEQEPFDGDIAARLEHSAGLMVERLETKMELAARPKDDIKTRLRRIRGHIHQVRADPEKKADHQAAATWADEAMLALRVLSYSGSYLDENPTLDRFAETAEKLLEDAYSEAQAPHGDRHAFVEINEPVDLAEKLEAFTNGARDTVRELTGEFEVAVQGGLDAINAENGYPGGEGFTSRG